MSEWRLAIRRCRRRGFTLIEMLAVMLLMALLLSVALDFYIDLSRQATRATELTRGVRRAHAILDRVAADLEHAYLEKRADDQDPILHPWIFLAEPHFAENGSDRLKFVRRVTPRSTAEPASHRALVAYTLRRSEEFEEAFALHRWSSPELPDTLDRDFPLPEDPGDQLLADGIGHFEVRFLEAGTGTWSRRWDSSLIADSDTLPLAAEIEVSLWQEEELEPDPDLFLDEEPQRYIRTVQLPLRPLDLQALFTPDADAEGEGAAGEEGDWEGLTVCDCMDPLDFDEISQLTNISTDELQLMYNQNCDEPWTAQWQSIAGDFSSC